MNKVQQGLEIHGLKEHGPWRYTVFNWFLVFSFDVLDSSLVKDFTSCMLIFFRLVIFLLFSHC